MAPKMERFRTSAGSELSNEACPDSRSLAVGGPAPEGGDPRDGTDPAPQHDLENHRSEEPTKRHSEVKDPDQAEQAPDRNQAGADPDVQAALPIDAVDLLFDAGRDDLHLLTSFHEAPSPWRRRCGKYSPCDSLPIPTTAVRRRNDSSRPGTGDTAPRGRTSGGPPANRPPGPRTTTCTTPRRRRFPVG